HSVKQPKPEDEFEKLFRKAAKAPAEIKRGHFTRFAHDKVLVVRDGDKATKVLTGSTNFSVTGFYVNSNHVLVFDDTGIAGTYAEVFDQVWKSDVKRAAFAESKLANEPSNFPKPPMQITFAPHDEAMAKAILDGIVARIEQERRGGNVLFAVMSLDNKGKSPVWEELREIHRDDSVFSFGISDTPEGIALYEPRRKSGVLVTGKPVRTQLPKPFNQVPNIGLGHQIHHKFVVCGFNSDNPVVYCGSSNLALGGEQENGDNLLEIHDPDVVTAFAIEALALVDHFQFLDRTQQAARRKPKARAKPSEPSRVGAAEDAGWFLSTSGRWADKYFDRSDLHDVDRRLFAS
ncbi:MAG: hypothetical protein QOE60_1548, partial [Thermoleophilaceae bacterium]|nr:hypothetical protein [Thermoleophilaceae bacterium]